MYKLEAITAPTLVVHGLADADVRYKHALNVAKRIPDSKLHIGKQWTLDLVGRWVARFSAEIARFPGNPHASRGTLCRSTMSLSAAKLRAELKARMAYHALLDEIPDAAWEHPSGNPAWNIREIAYHMTMAAKICRLTSN